MIYVSSDADILKFFHVANKAYDTLGQNLYQALLFQTRLQPYLNEVGLKIENNEFVLDYSGVLAKFGQVHAENPEKAFVDLGEFVAYSSNNTGLTELSLLMVQYAGKAVKEGRFEQYAEALGEKALEKLGYQLGTETDDRFYGNELSNLILGSKGNDYLAGYGGSDILEGGDGDDELHGDVGTDILNGGAGNDKLYGGGNEADTYVFAKGHGKDTVYDYGWGKEHTDTLIFENVEFSDAFFSRLDNDLTVKAYGNDDQVNIQNFFSSESYRYVEFKFNDQTADAAKVMASIG